MAVYVTTTFSPAMFASEVESIDPHFERISEENFATGIKNALSYTEVVPAIGDENTAKLLQRKLNLDIELFNRTNIELRSGDSLLVAIPKFRAPQAREFSDEEIEKARFDYWLVVIP